VYAIVRCGGRQEKASVDDVLIVDKLAGEVGSTVTLPAVLVVDDGTVISDSADLGGYQVTAEIVGAAAGPKINMIHFKSKTGFRRRQGHRQKYTQVRITDIAAVKSARSGSAKSAAVKSTAAKSAPEKSTGEKSAPARSTSAKAADTKAESAKSGAAKAEPAKSEAAKSEAAETGAAKTTRSRAAGKKD
jgi:large subunit ribosomal protein L21